jgi:hypothetical protein
MRPTRTILFACIATAVACQDAGVPDRLLAPTARPLASRVGGSAQQDTVRLVKRSSPLAANVSGSALIGPSGGTIGIDAAGVQITFPRGAVDHATAITVTALAGADVAYQFAPHGIVFAVPVTVEQDLRGTDAAKDKTLQGSYYTDDISAHYVDAGHKFARIDEARAAEVDVRGQRLRFTIGHFSGYLVSSGRTGRSDLMDDQ